MYVTLKLGTDDEQTLEDIAAVVNDGDGYIRLCRNGQPDETLDPEDRWIVIARG